MVFVVYSLKNIILRAPLYRKQQSQHFLKCLNFALSIVIKFGSHHKSAVYTDMDMRYLL